MSWAKGGAKLWFYLSAQLIRSNFWNVALTALPIFQGTHTCFIWLVKDTQFYQGCVVTTLEVHIELAKIMYVQLYTHNFSGISPIYTAMCRAGHSHIIYIYIYIYLYIYLYDVYRTKSISPPPNYCFLVGAVTGRWSNLHYFLKGAVVGR